MEFWKKKKKHIFQSSGFLMISLRFLTSHRKKIVKSQVSTKYVNPKSWISNHPTCAPRAISSFRSSGSSRWETQSSAYHQNRGSSEPNILWVETMIETMKKLRNQTKIWAGKKWEVSNKTKTRKLPATVLNKTTCSWEVGISINCTLWELRFRRRISWWRFLFLWRLSRLALIASW